jgi:hypothetical protein
LGTRAPLPAARHALGTRATSLDARRRARCGTWRRGGGAWLLLLLPVAAPGGEEAAHGYCCCCPLLHLAARRRRMRRSSSCSSAASRPPCPSTPRHVLYCPAIGVWASAGCWVLGAGCWVLGAGCWVLCGSGVDGSGARLAGQGRLAEASPWPAGTDMVAQQLEPWRMAQRLRGPPCWPWRMAQRPARRRHRHGQRDRCTTTGARVTKT